MIIICSAVALGPAVGRALRGVRSQPERRVALLQRLVVSRAVLAAGAGRGRRLPAVLRAPRPARRRVRAASARARAARATRRPSRRRRPRPRLRAGLGSPARRQVGTPACLVARARTHGLMRVRQGLAGTVDRKRLCLRILQLG